MPRPSGLVAHLRVEWSESRIREEFPFCWRLYTDVRTTPEEKARILDLLKVGLHLLESMRAVEEQVRKLGRGTEQKQRRDDARRAKEDLRSALRAAVAATLGPGNEFRVDVASIAGTDRPITVERRRRRPRGAALNSPREAG